MKRKITSTLLLVLVLALALNSCGGGANPWDDATYTEDTTLGTGAKCISVKIECGENAITLTVNTDEANVGAALYGLGLINDPSFFDVLNGVLASWTNDQAYWAFYVGDTMSAVGVDAVEILGGENFKFVYTKLFLY